LTTCERPVVPALEQAICQRIGTPRYQLWFERHAKFTWEDDQLIVGVPNLHFQEWLQKTFVGSVREAAAEVFERPMDVRFIIDAELFQAARKQQADSSAHGVAADATTQLPPPKAGGGCNHRFEARPQKPPTPKDVHPARAGMKDVPPPGTGAKRRWRRLSEFVVGSCNRVAFASAQSVVEAPGDGANPLVVHGPVGTGKTHLLEGIYAGLRRNKTDWRVCFVTAEDFTNRFVQAMRLGKLGAFRKHFRECDALLLDDLHFLATKKATQEEFQHTFDALQRDGKQLVVTCDCHPKLCDDFAPELADRLLGGAVWGVTPPDAETRLALLLAYSVRGNEPPMPEAVLRHVADGLRGNVRELEGALHSLRHFSRVTGRSVDLELAREALADLMRHSVRVVQLSDVDQAVRKVLRLESGALQSKARRWAVSHPRMLAMHVARKHTSASHSEVGQYFGGRNHSTAVAAEKKVRQWVKADGELHLGERTLRVRGVIELVERELLR
jgi:chromosomal replication initiator protein